MLKYLKKHEHFEKPKDYTSRFNADIQPLYHVERHNSIHTIAEVWRLPLEKEWMETCASLNAEAGEPENSGSLEEGDSYHSLRTIDTSTPGMMGTRSYSTTGYFLPNAQRPNLHVLTEALVTKIVVEKNWKRNRSGVCPYWQIPQGSYQESGHSQRWYRQGSTNPPALWFGNSTILSKAGVHLHRRQCKHRRCRRVSPRPPSDDNGV
jgi:hypothetical protein